MGIGDCIVLVALMLSNCAIDNGICKIHLFKLNNDNSSLTEHNQQEV